MAKTRNRLKALWRRDIKRRFIAGSLDIASALARAGMMSNTRGRGAIFTLHHVRPRQYHRLPTSAHLEITPDFLNEAIERLVAEGYDFISLEEVPARLEGSSKQPFAAFTLDDGYRNNAEYAAPVFRRHNVPFTIFVARGFAERSHSLWWETLAMLLRDAREISFDFGDGPETLMLTSEARKFDAFDRLSDFVENADEAHAVAQIDALARRHGIDPLQITADLTMDAAELKAIADDPLVSLGAHTISHRALSRLSPQEARTEMRLSAEYVETITGKRPVSIAYPYGTPDAVCDRDQAIAGELGFTVGVTTQPRTLGEKQASRIMALPRISLNGYYQQPRYVSALASGIPFTLDFSRHFDRHSR